MLSPAQNDRLRALFAEAAELPEHELAAFCAAHCAEEPELRAELESLLALRPDDTDQFLQAPAAALDEGELIEIGPYRLLERIGEGGMGIVYRAEQSHPVRREVAVKLIRPGMDSARVVARFEAERQALARMDHPHIARIHGAGALPEGRPYFVMELVRGEPLVRYCDQHRLGLRARLGLFTAVCDAVQHAHQKSVVHRDLKPSNILVTEVDGRPTPKVIDFGIARAVSETGDLRSTLTGQGEMIGTLQYMSPEQADGDPDVDARADIYALGVVLYELITGQLPFDDHQLEGRPLAEVQRILREEEPRRPSTRLTETRSPTSTATEHAARRQTDARSLRRTLTGDLDWITLAALDKDRERRYPSASELAADVRRYLADQPISAGPPSGLYRLRKFARRNRAVVAATALIAVSLFAGLASTGTALVWALDEEEQARNAQTQAAAARSAAERSARQADERADQLQRIVDFQSGQLSRLDASAMGVEIWNGFREQVRQVLDRSGSRPTEIAAALTRLEDLARGIRFPDLALGLLHVDMFQRAVRTIERDFDEQPAIQARLLLSIAQAMQKLGLDAAALPLAIRASLFAERSMGREADTTISALLLIGVLRLQGDPSDLTAIEQLVLDTRARCDSREHPADALTVQALRNLAALRLLQDRVTEAIEVAGVAVSAAADAFGPNHVVTGRTLRELVTMLIRADRLEAAKLHVGRAVEILDRAGEPLEASRLRRQFAEALLDTEEAEPAIQLLATEAEQLRHHLGDDATETLEARQLLARALFQGGRAPQARDQILAILPVLRETSPPGSARLTDALRLLAAVGAEAGLGSDAGRQPR